MANKKAKEPDSKNIEKNIQKVFEEEIQKPYYDVFYLDDFKLPYKTLDVSVVISTFNRCPFKPESLKELHNPLIWALKTCLMQKPKIKEIIIVDDNSTDNTKKVVEKIKKYAQEKFNIPIVYIKNIKRLGPGKSRNVGAKQASAKYIYFVDDDCFITPYSAFGAVFTFEKLEEKGVKIGLINLPTYARASIPKKVVKRNQIGMIDFIKGEYKANKEAFPEEYLEMEPSEKFLEQEFHILTPFTIQNVNTTTLLCSKNAFEEVEGFSESALKRMEDRDFGFRILDNGYLSYFQPDPKFHCVHGSYGLHTKQKFEGKEWIKKIDKSISLKKAMEICDNPKEETGARVNPTEYIYQSILSFFILTYFRNKKGAIKWIKKVHQKFVMNGETDIFGDEDLPKPNKEERGKMWKSAINDALEYVKEEERKGLQKINRTIKKLKKEEKAEENILPILESLQ